MFRDRILQWALTLVLRYVAEWLTPAKIEEGKVKLVTWLMKEAKTQTPDFPFDEELVRVLAAAIGVHV